jgi:MFS family permease
MNNNNQPDQSAAGKPAFFYGYIVAIAAFCICFAAFGTRLCYGIFFTPMSGELGWNNATTALAFSISALIEGLFNIILGGVTDKYGPRIVLTVCGLLIGLGYCLMPLVHNIWQFYVFYGLIVGMGMGGIFVPLITMIARWFKLRRTLMSGLVVAGNSIGLMVSSPSITALIAAHGWRTTFLIIGITVAVIIVIAAQFLKRDPHSMGLLPDGVQTGSTQELLPKVTGLSFKEALKTNQVWLIFGIFLTTGFFFAANQIYIVPDAIQTGVSSQTAALILSTFGAVNIVSLILLGALGDKIGPKRIYVLCVTLCLLASLSLVTNDLTASYFIFAVINGLGIGGLGSAMSPLVASFFGLKSHGVIFGFCGFGNTVGQAIGPYLVGRVLDYNHNYNFALSACTVIAFIGLLLVLVLKPMKNYRQG